MNEYHPYCKLFRKKSKKQNTATKKRKEKKKQTKKREKKLTDKGKMSILFEIQNYAAIFRIVY